MKTLTRPAPTTREPLADVGDVRLQLRIGDLAAEVLRELRRLLQLP